MKRNISLIVCLIILSVILVMTSCGEKECTACGGSGSKRKDCYYETVAKGHYILEKESVAHRDLCKDPTCKGYTMQECSRCSGTGIEPKETGKYN